MHGSHMRGELCVLEESVTRHIESVLVPHAGMFYFSV